MDYIFKNSLILKRKQKYLIMNLKRANPLYNRIKLRNIFAVHEKCCKIYQCAKLLRNPVIHYKKM